MIAAKRKGYIHLCIPISSIPWFIKSRLKDAIAWSWFTKITTGGFVDAATWISCSISEGRPNHSQAAFSFSRIVSSRISSSVITWWMGFRKYTQPCGWMNITQPFGQPWVGNSCCDVPSIGRLEWREYELAYICERQAILTKLQYSTQSFFKIETVAVTWRDGIARVNIQSSISYSLRRSSNW